MIIIVFKKSTQKSVEKRLKEIPKNLHRGLLWEFSSFYFSMSSTFLCNKHTTFITERNNIEFFLKADKLDQLFYSNFLKEDSYLPVSPWSHFPYTCKATMLNILLDPLGEFLLLLQDLELDKPQSAFEDMLTPFLTPEF